MYFTRISFLPEKSLLRSHDDFWDTLYARVHTEFFREEFALCSPFDAFCSIVPLTLEQAIWRCRCRRVASVKNIRQMPRESEESVVHFCARRCLVLSFRGEQSTLIVGAENEKSVAKKIPKVKRDSTVSPNNEKIVWRTHQRNRYRKNWRDENAYFWGKKLKSFYFTVTKKKKTVKGTERYFFKQ